MTNEEKQEIVNAVLAALHTHGKTIGQLTPVTSPSDSDTFELSGGRNLSYGKLKDLITAIFTEELQGYVPTDSLTDYIEQYLAKLDTNGALNWQESPVVMLATMGTTYDNVDGALPDYTLQEGDMYYQNIDGYHIHKKTSSPGNSQYAKPGVIYLNMRTMHMYKWTGSTMMDVGIKYTNMIQISKMNQTNVVDIPVGKVHYVPSLGRLVYRITINDTYAWAPSTKLLYIDVSSNTLYRWQGNSFQKVSSNINVVNNLTDGGEGDALSAEMGKIIRGNVDLIQEKVDALIDGTAIIDDMEGPNADTTFASASARVVKEIYNNLKALYDTVNGLANIAFIGTRPTWQTVAKRSYTLTFGTLTGLDTTTPVKDADGNAVTSGASVSEGYLKLILKPASSGYAFTSVTVNGESVTPTAVSGASDGSVYIEVVVTGNITLAATASSGVPVTFNSTGCQMDTSGLAYNTDFSRTITANEHFTLPSSGITVKVNNVSTNNYTYTPSQDMKTATLVIDKQYINGDIEITCNAIEDAHVTLAISGSNFVVKNGNDTLANGGKIYNGSSAVTLSIEPASGHKFTTLPTADKGTMTNNGAYAASTLVIDTTVSGTLTITAAASALETFSIDLSGLVGVTSSNAATSILEGSAYSTTLSKTDASASGSVVVGTCTMANGTLTISGTTISTSCVTGNITLAASIGTVPALVHSYALPYTTDENDKKYLADSTGNNFRLYEQADAGYNATQNYEAGTYANGKYDGYRKGYGASSGYRNILVENDFTVVLKDVAVLLGSNTNAIYGGSYQKKIKFYDRASVNIGTQDTVGQFELQLNPNADGTGFANLSGSMRYFITYYASGSTKKVRFYEADTTGYIPCNRPLIDGTSKRTHTYHFVMAYNHAAKTAVGYVIDIDNVNNTKELKLSASLQLEGTLRFPCICMYGDGATIKGLDVYNYTMSENDIKTAYNID